jgi:hypothetical protein
MLYTQRKHSKHVQTGTKRYNIDWNRTELRYPKINVVFPMLFFGAFYRNLWDDD